MVQPNFKHKKCEKNVEGCRIGDLWWEEICEWNQIFMQEPGIMENGKKRNGMAKTDL